MLEAKVTTTKRAVVSVSSEELDKIFSPERGLKLWNIERKAAGAYELVFGSVTESARLIGEETRFE